MIRVTAAIIKKDNEILITQRGKLDKLALKWEFPGGKIEEDENAEDCLVREIKEELNLKINIDDFYMRNIVGDIELNTYFAHILSGNIILNVHNDARWVKIYELKNFDFAQADIEIVKALINIKIL